jgi:hypothetical protein
MEEIEVAGDEVILMAFQAIISRAAQCQHCERIERRQADQGSEFELTRICDWGV